MSSDAQDVVYCTYHPNIPTTLRCARCGKPICSRDAQLTEVGYRCPDCVKQQQTIFYTGTWTDYVVAAIVSLPLAFGAALLLTSINLIWFFIIFLAPLAGGFIAEAVRWAVRRRRSRYLWLVACGAIVLGSLPSLVRPLVLLALGAGGGALLGLLFPVLYLILAVGAAYARLRF